MKSIFLICCIVISAYSLHIPIKSIYESDEERYSNLKALKILSELSSSKVDVSLSNFMTTQYYGPI